MPDNPRDALWSDACSQAAAIRSGAVSATDLVEAYFDRIDAVDDLLRAYVALDREGARAAARAADEAITGSDADDLPPFLGVTVSFKDVVDVAGLPTTHSCKVLADHVAVEDDEVVRRFRAAGFVVLGKTNIPEFCSTMTSSELNGVCRNPWDPELTPAGSSGGAAAALAAGLCAVAHGTDGAGSVRVPASFCGLVGLKPTRGLGFDLETSNPYYGTSVDGTLTRSVRDATATLDVLAGRRPTPPADERPEPGPLRVALTTTPPMGEMDPECAAAARTTAEVLASLGHQVDERTPEWNTILAAALGPMSVPGAAALVAPDQLDLVEPRNRPVIQVLASLTVVDHARWVDLVRAASREFLRFWDDIDVLLTPTCGVLPPSVDWAPWDQTPEEHRATFSTFPNFAQPFNLSGQPALSVPAAWSRDGLPIGVQLVGRRNDEDLLLQVAAQLETAQPWADRRPPELVASR
jgi:amidase